MKNICKLVDDIVKECQSRDPFTIAKKNNIIVLPYELGLVKGFFRIIGNQKFIAINNELSEFMTLIVLAHELGHAFLHDGEEFLDMKDNFHNITNKFEKEANIFSALLLFSEENYSEFYLETTYEKRLFQELYNILLEYRGKM